MIDIHTHIMPGVDDGARTLEESLRMLEDLVDDGVTDVFLTPHIGRLRGYGETKETYRSALTLLREKAASLKRPIVIHPGAEIDHSPDFIAHIDTYPTLNDTRTLLVDFTFTTDDVEDDVYEAKIRGYDIIIAHPERTTHFSLDTLVSLKRMGALFQVSAAYLIGYGERIIRRRALKLLSLDLVDFIASDLHRPLAGLSLMRACFETVKQKKGVAKAEALFDKNARRRFLEKV